MSDFNLQVITEETDENLTGLVIDGVPYLYWLRIYKALGITKAHATEVMKRLTEGVHYRKFTHDEINQISGTVNVSGTVDMRARAFYYLNEEGYNRAVLEISTSHMANQEIAAKINYLKDRMASIFTRYQRGEVVSKTVDLALKETPRDTFGITDKNLAIADSFIRHACPHLKIDPGLVISSSLAKAEQEIRNAGGTETLDHLKQMIPRALTGDPAMLTATTIGKHFSLPATRINDILFSQGYQYRQTTFGSRKNRKVWFPTEKGKPFGECKPVTFGHRNGSVHEETKWYWNPLIIDELHRILFPPELPSMTLTEVVA